MEFFIPGEIADLNTYVDAERSNKYAGAKIKKRETAAVRYQCSDIPPVEKYPVIVTFHWVVKNRRVDPDNVRFATKFVMDGLVLAGVLKNDTFRYIHSFGGDTFEVDPKNPGVVVTIEPA